MHLSRPFDRDTVTAEEAKVLYAEEVRQLYSGGFIGMSASIIGALILAFVEWHVASRTALAAWVAALIVVSVLRYRDILMFRRLSPETLDAGYWAARFIVGLALSGIVWGSSVFFLFPAGSFAHQTFLAFVIGGMVAGAAGAFSSMMKAFLAYSVPALGPIIVRFVALGDEFHLAMGGMTLFFGVMMFLIAWRIRAVRVTSVRLRFENSDLVSYLTALERTESELREARDGLEVRVEERTRELRNAYESLKKETREREQAEAQLRRAQRIEALGTLTGGVAHDFNNILAAIIGFGEMTMDRIPPESKARQSLARVLEAAVRGRDLVKRMLTFARQADQERRPLLLSGVVRETAQFLRASIPSTVSIRMSIDSESGFIFADPVQMQQMVMNLCANAAEAMREKGGILDVSIADVVVPPPEGTPHGVPPGLYTKLTVRDAGAGIPPDIIDRIFDPFFTTKKSGEGTGLGLSVVHGIVRSHGGHIVAESVPGKGTLFTVYLPKAEGEAQTETVIEEAVPTGRERVLFIDDEEPLVESGLGILQSLGYRVTAKTSSTEALATFGADPYSFDLLITDQTMPEMTGVELAGKILSLRPDMPIILCTGFSHLVDADKAKAAGVKAFVMKPLTKREIARTIRQVLDR